MTPSRKVPGVPVIFFSLERDIERYTCNTCKAACSTQKYFPILAFFFGLQVLGCLSLALRLFVLFRSRLFVFVEAATRQPHALT